MIQTMSKSWSEPMTARKIQILMVGAEQRQHDPPGYLP
jgi:hypothetical protein